MRGLFLVSREQAFKMRTSKDDNIDNHGDRLSEVNLPQTQTITDAF